MAISASQSVGTAHGRKAASIAFSHFNTTLPEHPSIDSIDYIPNTPIKVHAAARNFLGGKDAFLNYIKSKMEILPQESIRHEVGLDQIWRSFQAAGYQARTMLSYEPVVRKFYQRLFEALVDDGINWVEVRAAGSAGILVHYGDEHPDPDLDVWWEVMEDEIRKFQATEKGKRFWGARVIWSDFRRSDQASLIKSMKIALERKLKFPKLFCGYDVVAQEDLGRTLADMVPEFLWFQQQATSWNVSVPFFFHAGETLGDGNSTDQNLFDAILLGARRIGHGFSFYKHPHLIQEVIKKGIMVEVCPVSNEVLHLTTGILHHPLPALISHGVPTAISNDDPAILGQDAAGLSYDFYQVVQAFDNVGLAGLGALAQNSVRWSQFEDQSDADWLRDIRLADQGDSIKAKRIRDWNQQWEEFCKWVVSEFGTDHTFTKDGRKTVSEGFEDALGQLVWNTHS